MALDGQKAVGSLDIAAYMEEYGALISCLISKYSGRLYLSLFAERIL